MIADIITAIGANLDADTDITEAGYIKRDYHDDKLSVDDWRTGSIEFDVPEENVEVEPEIDYGGLAKVDHTIEFRVTKAGDGTPADLRNDVLAMVDKVKKAQAKPKNHLGVTTVVVNSVRWGPVRFMKPGPPPSESNLNKRVVRFTVTCREYQNAQTRA